MHRPCFHRVENDTLNVTAAARTLVRRPRNLFSGPSDWEILEVPAVNEDALESIMQSQERLREASAKRQTYAQSSIKPEGTTINEAISSTAIEASMFLLDYILFNSPCSNLHEYEAPPNVNKAEFSSISPSDSPIDIRYHPQFSPALVDPQQQISIRETILDLAQTNTTLSRQSGQQQAHGQAITLQNLLLQELEDDDDADAAADDPSTVGKYEEIEQSPAPPPPAASILLTEQEPLSSLLGLEGDDALLAIPTQLSSKPPPARSNKSTAAPEDSASRTSWADTTPLDESIFDAMKPKLAMRFPFELDFFQKQAIMRLERKESVFVAAHTSAGKTVVAEYAIAMSQQHLTRTIYTSPIKALSNQKYRDFREKFGADVGLITGDVSVNPDAACLIMTTEILRSMLYRGSDIVRDIEWVIFDEVHYVNDAERGVVWEEVIIMLPEHISLIFLSATTPNTIEFSDWIGRTKRRKVYVTSTPKRPVPLQHFLLYDDEYYKLMSAETGFNAAAIATAAKREREKLKPKSMSTENASMKSQREGEKLAAVAASQGRSVANVKAAAAAKNPGGSSKSGPVSTGHGAAGRRVDVSGSKAQWLSLLRVLRGGGREAAGGLGRVHFDIGPARFELEARVRSERAAMEKWERMPEEFRRVVSKKEYERTQVRAEEEEGLGADEGGLLPVVVFCFSKKKCEEIADHLCGQDLLSAKEKNHVKRSFAEVRQRLSVQDQRLPQMLRMEEMLLRGVGVHHGGLLPILKESTEILFSKGIVKVLVATETFAMGVNMPARSVVFNGFRKHDGRGFRDLLPGEYTQMAGRAGRRGLDKVGTVLVAAWSELPAEVTIKQLLTGTATKLSSQFRLSYGMILNLLRVNDMPVEDMIKRSFSEFHTQRQLAGHDMKLRLAKAEARLRALTAQTHADDSIGDTERAIIDRFQAAFSLSQAAVHAQIQYLSSPTRDKELHACLAIGRVCWVFIATQGGRTCGSPSLAVILADPDMTALLQMPPPSASQIGLGLGLTKPAALTDPARGGDKDTRSVWIMLWLSNDAAKEFADAVSAVGNIASTSSPSSWKEAVEVLDDFGYWLVCIPVASIGMVLQERIKIPSWASESGASGRGLGLSGRDGGGSPRPRMPNTSELNNIAASLNVVCAKVISKSPFAHLPSLAFVESHEALSPPVQASMSPLDVPKECRMMGLESTELQMRCNACYNFEAIAALFLLQSPLRRRYLVAHKISRVKGRINAYQYFASTANLALFPDYQQRLRVLRMLNYVEQDRDTVALKGRAACEMNTCHELLATEAIFGNVLEPLTPPEAAAILSSLVFQEKSDDSTRLTSRMECAREQLQDILCAVIQLQDQEGVVSGEELKPALNFGICAVVYQWARGVSFKEITQMTLIHEGSIVRCITRLDELLKDVRNAARVVGNPSLYRKMVAASLCIKRDIVFAASLYI